LSNKLLDSNNINDIDKLRKFALIAALMLVSYSSAGIKLEPNARASLFGIPFIISNPELLSLGLVLLSLYGLLRYYYYGHMLSASPYRKRKELLCSLMVEGGQLYRGSAFWGPSSFSIPILEKRRSIEDRMDEFIKAFPRVGKYKLNYKINSTTYGDPEGEEFYTAHGAKVTIPLICRFAAIVQDIDYSAPVWANLGALIIWGLRTTDLVYKMQLFMQ